MVCVPGSDDINRPRSHGVAVEPTMNPSRLTCLLAMCGLALAFPRDGDTVLQVKSPVSIFRRRLWLTSLHDLEAG